MLQIIGKCCVCVGLGAIGVLLRLGLHSRVACLRDFLRGLECLERELAFALPPVDELLTRLIGQAGRHSRDFYLRCQTSFSQREEERFEEIWARCLAEATLPLEEEDLQLLGEAGRIIGRYDSDSQRLALRHIHARLTERIDGARDEARRMGRVYATLGLSLGLFAAILL